MKSSTRTAVWACAVLAVLAALGWWQRGPITLALMTKQVAAMTAMADPLAALPDGLHVGLCGAGSPFPDEKRSGPCTAVVAGRSQPGAADPVRAAGGASTWKTARPS